MTGAEFRAIRQGLGFSVIAWGRAFGYLGSDATVNVTVRRYEGDARPIPPWIARLAIMFSKHGVPRDWR